MKKINALLITKGHPFERGPFFDMYDSLEIEYTHIEHPAAEHILNPNNAVNYNLLCFYDMPGMNFDLPEDNIEIDPNEDFKEGFNQLLEEGKPMLFIHHSIAGWPAWDQYAEIIGGKFLYKEKKLRGKLTIDSGYRHDITHVAKVVNPHPITEGIKEIKITDEVYLYEIFEDSIYPLLTSDYLFEKENFYSANNAINGQMYNNDNWDHPPGLGHVAWVKSYKNSPIVYLQMGDGPSTYKNKTYRKLLRQSIDWLTSKEAQEWVQNEKEKKNV